MPLDRPLTAADILNYEPSEEQKKHGFRTYAARLMVEGVRFEKAGNELQAKLRYEKCKAYCKLRGVAFPPFSEGKTALMEAVEQAPEVTTEWVRGEKVVPARPSKNNPTGLKPLKKKGKKGWNGDREACKARGQMLWFNRLLKAGDTEAAAAFAHRHSLPVAGQLSVARTSVQRDSATGPVVSPHSTPTTEPTSDGARLAEGGAGNPPQPTAPSEPLPLAKLSLREQLMRQIEEMDAAEKAAGVPQVSPPMFSTDPAAFSVNIGITDGFNVYLQTSDGVIHKKESAPEPVKQPVAVVPNSPAKGVRQCVVQNFVVNPRLIRIRFTDTPAGSPPEYASMLIDRIGLRLNDKLEVVHVEGGPSNPIYRETRKRT